MGGDDGVGVVFDLESVGCFRQVEFKQDHISVGGAQCLDVHAMAGVLGWYTGQCGG